MYRLTAWIFTIVTAPIWIPLGLYIGLTYNWQDTVPSDDDLNYGSEGGDTR